MHNIPSARKSIFGPLLRGSVHVPQSFTPQRRGKTKHEETFFSPPVSRRQNVYFMEWIMHLMSFEHGPPSPERRRSRHNWNNNFIRSPLSLLDMISFWHLKSYMLMDFFWDFYEADCLFHCWSLRDATDEITFFWGRFLRLWLSAACCRFVVVWDVGGGVGWGAMKHKSENFCCRLALLSRKLYQALFFRWRCR